MSKVRVYIVEDEPLIAETIKVALSKEGIEVVGEADNIGDAFFQIDDLQPDLVFLDVTLDGKQDGIQLGRKLSQKSGIPFIYLTSHSDRQTVEMAGETRPAGYILKPFSSKDLKVAVDLALMNRIPEQKEDQPEFFFVKQQKRWVKLDAFEIILAKADDTYTELYTENERYVLSQSLKYVEEKLDGSTFKRVHRSYLVNIHAIKAIDEDVLTVGSHLIPVGKTYRKELMDSLNFL